MPISTNGTVIARFAGALYNQQLSNATYEEVVTWSNTNPLSGLLNAVYQRDFSNATDAAVANIIITNLGLAAVPGLGNWLAAQLTAAGANKGAKIAELLNGFAQTPASDPVYGAAAAAWNNQVANSQILSQTEGNAGGEFSTLGTTPAGATFTLTTGLDTIVGTSGNDTINAVPVQGMGIYSGGVSTLNGYDSIDGGAGADTLNIYTGDEYENAGNENQVGTISNVETINIHNDYYTFGDYDGGVDASGFAGATQIWQINDSTDIYNLAASTTAGFRDLHSDADIGAATDAASVSIALDNTDGSHLYVYGDSLTAVNVAGTLDQSASAGYSDISLTVEAGFDVQTVTVNTAVDTNLSVEQFGYSEADGWSLKAVTTVNAGASTGDIYFDGYDTVASVTTGSGDDEVYLNTVTAKAVAVPVTAAISAVVATGAGDDYIEVNTTGTGTTTVAAGEGDDEVYVASRGTGVLTVDLGAGVDDFSTGVAINGTDVIDGGAGVDTLLLSLVGAANVGAFKNFETFDAVGLDHNLDLDILALNNTVTEIIASGALGADVGLLNLGAGVGFRATADMGGTYGLGLTQKTAGALTVTLDADETGTADLSIDAATMKVGALNATSVTAVFDTSYLDKVGTVVGETVLGDNVSTIGLRTVAATSLAVVSGGANSLNTLNVLDDAATAGKLASITITGASSLTLDTSSTFANALTSVDASASTGGLTFALADLKNGGTVTLGSGVDTITADATSTTGLIESISGLEKAAAGAFGATASATTIADSDKIVLTGAMVLDANVNALFTISKGILTFTGAGPSTLADAIGLADLAAETVGEAAVFNYLSDSYVFVQGDTETVVKLVGITGATEFAEVGATDAFMIG